MIYGSHVDNDDFKEAFRNGSVPYHLDLKRLRDGLSGGAFWSVYAPCPEDGDDFSDENYVDCEFWRKPSLARSRMLICHL